MWTLGNEQQLSEQEHPDLTCKKCLMKMTRRCGFVFYGFRYQYLRLWASQTSGIIVISYQS